jgi:hypothetical protein
MKFISFKRNGLLQTNGQSRGVAYIVFDLMPAGDLMDFI